MWVYAKDKCGCERRMILQAGLQWYSLYRVAAFAGDSNRNDSGQMMLWTSCRDVVTTQWLSSAVVPVVSCSYVQAWGHPGWTRKMMQ